MVPDERVCTDAHRFDVLTVDATLISHSPLVVIETIAACQHRSCCGKGKKGVRARTRGVTERDVDQGGRHGNQGWARTPGLRRHEFEEQRVRD